MQSAIMSEEASSTVVEEPAASSSSVAQEESAKENMTVWKQRPWLPLAAILVLYTIGIAWHVILHPSISVFTGQMKQPRRLYIDENSAEISYFRANHPKYPSFASSSVSSTKRNKRNQKNRSAASLCQALKSSKNQASGSSSHHHHHHHTADSFSSISCHNSQGCRVRTLLASAGNCGNSARVRQPTGDSLSYILYVFNKRRHASDWPSLF